MGNPKRMSELFASSAEKDANTTTMMGTPRYSSEGPTLPIIGALEDASKVNGVGTAGKKRKAKNKANGTASKKLSQRPSPPTIHPSLYEPWVRLPTELRKVLEAHKRMRVAQNIIPVVFSKNQNVKSGINRLKTYLGAYRDPASTIEMPDALKEDDLIIAVSAQGEGTTRLVGIVDMVRRIVAPSRTEHNMDAKEEVWWMYTMLTSVDIDRAVKTAIKTDGGNTDAEQTQSTQEEEEEEEEEEEAFGSTDLDRQDAQGSATGNNIMQRRTVPVITVWMTKKRIPVLQAAFGEQTFAVQLPPKDSD
ncbi:hypothetical protein G6011_08873 [Alternaria panax]|uniref:Uncharacterized protein n=1 Tax=Alternaria panax TaxID=48097 RepID=A0AAD4IA23_9PLEO|nr:hypothetical protein G6011_08873 [Alternaria panax]